jgi:hypothetical protein
MTSSEQRRPLSPDDQKMVAEVYQHRARYYAWLIKSVLTGVLSGAALGWASSSILEGFWLNPLTWLGLLWGTCLRTALTNAQGLSTARAILTAPLIFKRELSRKSAEARAGHQKLVTRFRGE